MTMVLRDKNLWNYFQLVPRGSNQGVSVQNLLFYLIIFAMVDIDQCQHGSLWKHIMLFTIFSKKTAKSMIQRKD